VLGFLLAGLCACGDDGGGGAADAGAIDAASVDAQDLTATRTDVTFSSGVNLTGYLTTSNATPAGSPGVLLIHQYMSNDEQWGQWPEVLVAKGYRVLAFNLRGHGDSDPYGDNLIGILSDPDAAPVDVRAALAYLVGEGQADPTRIAIIGTSIGANLTVEAAIADLAKTYVSLSSRETAAGVFAGGSVTGMSSVFYLASENDSAGTQATDAQTMYDATTDPREIKIYAGTADHGVAILNNQSDSRGLIETWLEDTL
jgi:dienelactone hydrolase